MKSIVLILTFLLVNIFAENRVSCGTDPFGNPITDCEEARPTETPLLDGCNKNILTGDIFCESENTANCGTDPFGNPITDCKTPTETPLPDGCSKNILTGNVFCESENIANCGTDPFGNPIIDCEEVTPTPILSNDCEKSNLTGDFVLGCSVLGEEDKLGFPTNCEIDNSCESLDLKTLTIKKGWNLIANPISQNIFSSNFDYKDIWSYENSAWINPAELKPKLGYWINSNIDKSYSFEGDSYDLDLAGLTSWNLLGTSKNLINSDFDESKKCIVSMSRDRDISPTFAYKEVKIKDDVNIVDVTSWGESGENNGTVLISVSDENIHLIESLKVSDVIVSSSDNGFLKKIVDIEFLDSNNIILKSSDVDLFSLFSQATIEFSEELRHQMIDEEAIVEDRQRARSLGKEPYFNIIKPKDKNSKNITLVFGDKRRDFRDYYGLEAERDSRKVDINGNKMTFNESLPLGGSSSVTIDGEITLSLINDFVLNMNGLSLAYLRVAPTLTLSEDFTLSYESSAELSDEKIIGKISSTAIKFMVGPVPVIIKPVLEIDFDASQSLKAGVYYDGNLEPIFDIKNSFDSEYRVALEGLVGAYFKFTPKLLFYSVIGPNVDFISELIVEAKLQKDNLGIDDYWDLYFYKDLGWGIDTSSEISELGFWQSKLVDKLKDILDSDELRKKENKVNDSLLTKKKSKSIKKVASSKDVAKLIVRAKEYNTDNGVKRVITSFKDISRVEGSDREIEFIYTLKNSNSDKKVKSWSVALQELDSKVKREYNLDDSSYATYKDAIDFNTKTNSKVNKNGTTFKVTINTEKLDSLIKKSRVFGYKLLFKYIDSDNKKRELEQNIIIETIPKLGVPTITYQKDKDRKKLLLSVDKIDYLEKSSAMFTVYASTLENDDTCPAIPTNNNSSANRWELVKVLRADSSTSSKIEVDYTLSDEDLEKNRHRCFFTSVYMKGLDAVNSTNVEKVEEELLEDECKIQLYFNEKYKKHKNYAIGTNFREYRDDFIIALVSRLESVKSSIDLAIYEIWNVEKIKIALLNAKKRGVEVRVVTSAHEDKYLEKIKDKRVIDALVKGFDGDLSTADDNIEVLLNQAKESISREYQIEGVRYAKSPKKGSLMHNKFIIIDKKLVGTGSWNYTDSGTYDNIQNLIFIKNHSLANIYTKEFETMWSGSFSKQKIASTSKEVKCRYKNEDINITTIFSPKTDAINYLNKLVKGANHSVHFLTFALTDKELISSILAKNSKLDVKGVINSSLFSYYSKHLSSQKQKRYSYL